METFKETVDRNIGFDSNDISVNFTIQFNFENAQGFDNIIGTQNEEPYQAGPSNYFEKFIVNKEEIAKLQNQITNLVKNNIHKLIIKK